ncbi:PPOX class F420-dependent oxidoreductase [Mycobacterium sp. CBMA293]|uniref:PPOX class F420-dependent oxidoreductase n=1 Tax=unclassified Mycolicibacterium TaxID=2636767 RepID=UPI0012DCC311|nr:MULTISPECIES: PPOX class F420-dependent oxidoreductase [unclassified Mycolicibacterium]MUL47189.1 PPOX class F420-dependent oxidoreductase [Mycolicibacterium sp. CBMA 360]MUL61298.1 PPOX class F420-dependent oxidoreductase [Mycolicibacterium sp. CBMA 335]MUL72033.1 PPOX class F420-dependent oxidoreductase [Mycolicibacterium sp. CBMA 311]MUL96200.1 PPOX class F420-dependent oxidoreductase [Mycolicibacterium sp. CBMA 230]MUM08976.1 F420-dependent protein [Mycolicibacterium sp. CBMA 213]
MASPAYDPRDLIADSKIGILATIRSSGMPQLSPVTAVYDRDADVIYVSMRSGLAKEANLRRDPRAAIEYTGPDRFTWATAEGTATLTGPSTDPDGPEVDALVAYYRLGAGEHPDWREYREAMVVDRRVLLALKITHVYGAKLR